MARGRSYFEGIADASTTTRNPRLALGPHDLQVKRVFMHSSDQFNTDFFTVEFESLSHDPPEGAWDWADNAQIRYRDGDTISIGLNASQKAFLGNVKSFLRACVPALEDDQLKAFVDKAIEESNPMEGLLVSCNGMPRTSQSSGRKYIFYSWSELDSIEEPGTAELPY